MLSRWPIPPPLSHGSDSRRLPLPPASLPESPANRLLNFVCQPGTPTQPSYRKMEFKDNNRLIVWEQALHCELCDNIIKSQKLLLFLTTAVDNRANSISCCFNHSSWQQSQHHQLLFQPQQLITEPTTPAVVPTTAVDNRANNTSCCSNHSSWQTDPTASAVDPTTTVDNSPWWPTWMLHMTGMYSEKYICTYYGCASNLDPENRKRLDWRTKITALWSWTFSMRWCFSTDLV